MADTERTRYMRASQSREPSPAADLWALTTGPHPFEERVLIPGTPGSYCFFCDGVESDPIHRGIADE